MPARVRIAPVNAERVGHFILVIRRQRVLLDSDLAALYDVETRVLLQAVRRNLERFPPDFMFQLSAAEWTSLRSQVVTSTPHRGGRRYAPHAFTEQGVAMLSSVLNSDRAIAVNIEIMRSFVRIRKLLEADKSLARKFERLEQKLASHDQAIVGILTAIRQLMQPPMPKRRGIGFTADLGD
jgi:ORF6N domain